MCTSGLGEVLPGARGVDRARRRRHARDAFVEHDLANLAAEPRPKDRARTWVYSDASELKIALGGIARLLQLALPVLEPLLASAVEPQHGVSG